MSQIEEKIGMVCDRNTNTWASVIGCCVRRYYTNANADTHTYVNANTDPNADADPYADTDTDSNANSNANRRTDGNTAYA